MHLIVFIERVVALKKFQYHNSPTGCRLTKESITWAVLCDVCHEIVNFGLCNVVSGQLCLAC